MSSLSVLLLLLVVGIGTSLQIGPFTQIDDNCQTNNVAGDVIVNPIDEYQYLVSLQVANSLDSGYYEHTCGGTLLFKGCVLTAASCIWDACGGIDYRTSGNATGSINGDFYAVISPLCRHQEGSGRFQVQKYYIHPEYDGVAQNGHDIAILKFEDSQSVGQGYVDYLNAGNFDTAQDLTVIGWADDTQDEAMGTDAFRSTVKPLLQTKVTYVDHNDCSLTIHESQFCAKSTDVNDTCIVDSGSPALDTNAGKPVQVGIVTGNKGMSYCNGDGTGVFTRVSDYIQWITEVLLYQKLGDTETAPAAPSPTAPTTPAPTAPQDDSTCTVYTTNGAAQISVDEGTGIFSPNGAIFMLLPTPKECAAACEATNSKCQSVCCDSFAFNPDKQECWLKFGSSRETQTNEFAWQTYWRDDGNSPDTSEFVQVCEQDWLIEGYELAYFTKGQRQLSVQEGISIAMQDGSEWATVASVNACALECEAVDVCNAFSYNPSITRCFLKMGQQEFNTSESNTGWQSYWQVSGDTATEECAKQRQYCIYCGGTLGDTCRSY
eukprot:TRINITY_DN5065_c0_g1_i1.p1 TRINITY_DN5065_c0_g1~~TRINITY_DN5065_c0_g1_i1.p1  ORF type:complete len:547 (+),score=42.45 TRINITY_DN5065_c0_g1_i1:115-1755(+)